MANHWRCLAEQAHCAVAVVAAEQFVAAVAGERGLAERAGGLAQPVRGQERTVGRGFARHRHETFEVRHGVADLGPQHRVLSPEVIRHHAGVGRLVVGRFGHRHAEGRSCPPDRLSCRWRIAPQITEESMPPDRKQPSGTSASSRFSTASFSTSSKASAAPSAVECLEIGGGRQYRCTSISPSCSDPHEVGRGQFVHPFHQRFPEGVAQPEIVAAGRPGSRWSAPGRASRPRGWR